MLIPRPPQRALNCAIDGLAPDRPVARVRREPVADGGVARIWAGDNRKIGGVTYSGVWIIPNDGPVRRLTAAEWRVVEQAYAAVGRPVPVAHVHGNDIEVLMYGPQAVKARA